MNNVLQNTQINIETYRLLREYSEILRRRKIENYILSPTIEVKVGDNISETESLETILKNRIEEKISKMTEEELLALLEYIIEYVGKTGFSNITDLVLDLMKYRMIQLKIEKDTEKESIELKKTKTLPKVSNMTIEAFKNISGLENKITEHKREKEKKIRLVQIYDVIKEYLTEEARENINRYIYEETLKEFKDTKGILDLKEREKAILEASSKNIVNMRDENIFLEINGYYVPEILLLNIEKITRVEIKKIGNLKIVITNLKIQDVKKIYTIIYQIMKYSKKYDDKKVEKYLSKNIYNNIYENSLENERIETNLKCGIFLEGVRDKSKEDIFMVLDSIDKDFSHIFGYKQGYKYNSYGKLEYIEKEIPEKLKTDKFKYKNRKEKVLDIITNINIFLRIIIIAKNLKNDEKLLQKSEKRLEKINKEILENNKKVELLEYIYPDERNVYVLLTKPRSGLQMVSEKKLTFWEREKKKIYSEIITK